MKTEHLLIEIGCEDLPSWSGQHFISRFKPLFLGELNNYKLTADDVMFFFTPRRFVIFIKGLSSKIPPERREITGPRYEAAFDKDGQATIAAAGFAKAHGVSVSSLKVKNVNGKKVVYVTKTIPGVATKDIIPDILVRTLRKIDIPKGMRWNESQEVFYRPVRWMLAIFGNQNLDVNFGGIKSSRYTYGHRILRPNRIRVQNWEDYFDKIQKSFVLLGEDLRQQFILNLISTNLKENENFEESMGKDLVNLIEYPRVIRCNFPSIDYNLPEEVLRVLIAKAKGIPIFCGEQLKKEYFVISDGNDNENVRVNYENLLKTRILDAQFFYNSDISVPFDEFGKKLDKIVFHQKWGSVAKKVERLKGLAFEFSEIMGLDSEQKKTLIRSAEICKNDLASEMVREFPDLHGTMGAIYAKLSGESEDVCRTIAEYMLPASPGDKLPQGICGILLGIIDRLDYVVAFISAGVDVSGSEDPYGLKRIAGGLFPLIYVSGFEYDYRQIVRKILEYYDIPAEEKNSISSKIDEFLIQRYESHLESEGFPRGLRRSVLTIDGMNFLKIRKKLEALKNFIKNDIDAEQILIPVTRIANILRQATERKIQIPEFHQDLIEESGERILAEVYNTYAEKSEGLLAQMDYDNFLKILSGLKEPVDNFFDSVLVMCPQEVLRNNRLALLKKFNDVFLKFADFSYIREEDIKNAQKY